MQGYLIINTIVGGQTLAEVSPHLDATLGIVIIALISLVVRALPTPPPSPASFISLPLRLPSADAKCCTGASDVTRPPQS